MISEMEVVICNIAIYPVIKLEEFDGVHYVYRFSNGYGASIIKHKGSYGVELAVVEWTDKNASDDDYRLTYDTHITSNVIGWLTYNDLIKTLTLITELPDKLDYISLEGKTDG